MPVGTLFFSLLAVQAIKRGNVTRHQDAPIVQIIAPLEEEPPAKSRDATAAIAAGGKT